MAAGAVVSCRLRAAEEAAAVVEAAEPVRRVCAV